MLVFGEKDIYLPYAFTLALPVICQRPVKARRHMLHNIVLQPHPSLGMVGWGEIGQLTLIEYAIRTVILISGSDVIIKIQYIYKRLLSFKLCLKEINLEPYNSSWKQLSLKIQMSQKVKFSRNQHTNMDGLASLLIIDISK